MEIITKCQKCGSEIKHCATRSLWSQWVVIPLILLVGFFPTLRMTLFKGDYKKDLVISEIERRENGRTIEILGLITNGGKRSWKHISVEAEFFDENGKFFDEETTYIRSDVSANSSERFKITLRSRDPFLLEEDTKVVVKVSSAHTSPF